MFSDFHRRILLSSEDESANGVVQDVQRLRSFSSSSSVVQRRSRSSSSSSSVVQQILIQRRSRSPSLGSNSSSGVIQRRSRSPGLGSNSSMSEWSEYYEINIPKYQALPKRTYEVGTQTSAPRTKTASTQTRQPSPAERTTGIIKESSTTTRTESEAGTIRSLPAGIGTEAETVIVFTNY